MYAIVKAGGHQEKVEVGDVIYVNRLEAKTTTAIVLALVGKPFIEKLERLKIKYGMFGGTA